MSIYDECTAIVQMAMLAVLVVVLTSVVFIVTNGSKLFCNRFIENHTQELHSKMVFLEHMRNILPTVQRTLMPRHFHTSTVVNRVQSGRYKITINKDKPLTYEMANPPHYIAHRKSWNSWNTSNIKDGNRPAETAVEDMFIRQFMMGTWHNLFASEIIIKRQHNIIRIAGIITRTLAPYKLYFLTGYTEELLSYWLQCPIKVELVTIDSKKDMIFKYI